MWRNDQVWTPFRGTTDAKNNWKKLIGLFFTLVVESKMSPVVSRHYVSHRTIVVDIVNLDRK